MRGEVRHLPPSQPARAGIGKNPRRRSPQATPAALQRPVFWGHGTSDPFVPHAIGEESVRELEAAGARDVTLRLYDGIEHDASPEELQDVRAFLQRVLPA